MHLHHLWLDFLNVRKNIINLKRHFRQGSNEIEQSYWMRVINWTLGPMAFRPRSKTKKWQIKAKPICHHFGEKINWFICKKKDKNESSRFEEPRGKLGSKARSNSRIQFAWNEFKWVPQNLDHGTPSKVGLSSCVSTNGYVLGILLLGFWFHVGTLIDWLID